MYGRLAVAISAFAALLDGLAMEASFDGRPLVVHPARVSAFPMNQVWAGYQRPVEQTKMASFVSFDMSAPGELAIVPAESEDRGEPIVLPLSWKPVMRRDGRALKIKIDAPRQFTVSFGAEGEVVHVFANPLFDEPHAKDEIVFGPGEHDVGVVVPKSGQTVRIEEGAVVYGSIFVAHARDVTITGRGRILKVVSPERTRQVPLTFCLTEKVKNSVTSMPSSYTTKERAVLSGYKR